MAKLILAFVVIILVIDFTPAQRAKPGKCPTSTGVGICANTCKNDYNCAGRQKCCRNGCGGSSCTEPATGNNNTNKPGRCPPASIQCFQAVCRNDADCSGNKKCCSGNCLCSTPTYNGK